MKLNDTQIQAVIDWMNRWQQLKDTAIPIRFKEDFSIPKTENDFIMDACWYKQEFECDCNQSCYHHNKNK